MKEFYNNAYKIDSPHKYGGGKDGMPERTKKLLKRTSNFLKKTGLDDSSKKVLEIGCGMAYLCQVHPNYYGAEYSRTAVDLVKQREKGKVKIYEEDAQKLTFDDFSFDGIFTFAALEHVPDPNKALQEVDRVLKYGGYALIAPAFNCRPWTVKKIQHIPYNELSFLEKIELFFIPLRENIIYRGVSALPKRITREFLLFFKSNKDLDYKKLSPRWDLIEKYGHESDDDAVASIDAHAAIVFFKSRGYEIVSHKNIMARLLAKGEGVVVSKLNK